MVPYLLVLLLSITLAVAGQVLLKSGLSELHEPSVPTIMLSMFTNLRVFFGYASFVFSSLLWLVVLRKLPLSYVYPMVSLGYVVAVILSWKVFGETISPLRVVAVSVILAGVILLAASYKPAGAGTQPAPAPAHTPSVGTDRGPS